MQTWSLHSLTWQRLLAALSPPVAIERHLRPLQAEVLLALRIEEVLPRPAAGLLARMLRLAPVDLASRPGTPGPVLVLRPHTHYQVSVRLYQVRLKI